MIGEHDIGDGTRTAPFRWLAGSPWRRLARGLTVRAGLLLVGACLLLYGVTLDNGLQPHELHGGDLITHQYAQVQARPSNAPGYPLYTMGGWLWFHSGRTLLGAPGDPLPNPIPILSSYSTLWALLALWLFYRILCRVTATPTQPHGNRPVAWLLVLFLAVTYFFWYYATTTEQYSSAVAQTLAIVYVYLLWRESASQLVSQSANQPVSQSAGQPVSQSAGQPVSQSAGQPVSQSASQLVSQSASQLVSQLARQPVSSQQPTANSLLLLLAFLCGLSLAHMLTVAFIVPPLVALVLWDAPHLLRRPRLLGGVILAAALPLVSYLYVYARGAAHPEWWGAGDWATAREWFWDFVSTAQGREELSWGLEPGRAFWGGGFPEMMWQELSLPLFILGLVGIALLGRRLAFLLYATLVIYFAFCWTYRFGNWFQVILPAYPLILVGVAKLIDNSQRSLLTAHCSLKRRTRRLLALTPVLLLAVAILWRVDASLPAADSRNRPGDTALDRAALLLDQPLPPGAPVFAAVDDALALHYLTDIWRIRPDVRVVDRKAAARSLDRDDAAVYVTVDAAPRLYDELRLDWQPHVQSATPDWVQLLPVEKTRHAPAVLQRLDNTLLPGVTLVGYSVQPGPNGAPVTQAAPSLDVTLYWQLAKGAWPEDVSISVRPTHRGAFIPAADGEGIIQRDAPGPVQGLLDRTPVAPDAQIADAYRLPVAAEQADGLAVILYRASEAGFENLAEVRWSLERLPAQ
jgi:hypothetical protein